MGAEEKQRLPLTASRSRTAVHTPISLVIHDLTLRAPRKNQRRCVSRTVFAMKILSLILVAVSLALSACSSQPVPPYQSGDGGRGLNPGARAESSTGAFVDRTATYSAY